MWYDVVLVIAVFLIVLSVALFSICATQRDIRAAQMQVLSVPQKHAPTAELE